jgi:pSer/pThr/pTyr-binding forkhead associated (FHA) protein
VNGEEVEGGASLSDGDEIRVGRSTFRFRVA